MEKEEEIQKFAKDLRTDSVLFRSLLFNW
jgi:hypothetical protein